MSTRVPTTLSHPETTRLTTEYVHHASVEALLQRLLNSSLVLAEDWEQLPTEVRAQTRECSDCQSLLSLLVRHGLLTAYQAERISSGASFGLVLGNYRILDRLGAGGVGVVYKAEHLELRRVVAIKVMSALPELDFSVHLRFLTEMRIVAQLHHPNIVAAIDAGRVSTGESPAAGLRYFVMEFVPGQDLNEYVRSKGPLAPAAACNLAYQVASALEETHKHHLVHRDIKPSNVCVTPAGEAKLLDFGVARHLPNRLTEPGVLLGTLVYMAPEQAQDASAVDIRADIYSLGGTLFWCLTGHPPFELKRGILQQLTSRLTARTPSVRVWRPELSAELDAIVMRMLAPDPAGRYATPHAVMSALLPFLRPPTREPLSLATDAEGVARVASPGQPRNSRVLLVDDDIEIRRFCRYALEAEGLLCDEAANGLLALAAAKHQSYEVILLDIDMPEMTGLEACRRLREEPPGPNLKIIMLSGRESPDALSRLLLIGVDDYVPKPMSVVQLQSRVQAALRLKAAQDRADQVNQHLLAINHELEANLTARASDLVHARNALVLALAKLVEYRDTETGAHLTRLARYSRMLAAEAAHAPAFAGQIDAHYIELLECCAPLHDIGKVGLPDHILLKPGPLAADERIIMQTHTTIGADILQAVAERHGSAVAFLQLAMDIARHHHERFDGQGYPDRLSATAIPLAARIVAIGDVYDALRSRRSYKPALSHTAACQIMTQVSQGQFDPALLHVFERCAQQFERVYHELGN